MVPGPGEETPDGLVWGRGIVEISPGRAPNLLEIGLSSDRPRTYTLADSSIPRPPKTEGRKKDERERTTGLRVVGGLRPKGN